MKAIAAMRLNMEVLPGADASLVGRNWNASNTFYLDCRLAFVRQPRGLPQIQSVHIYIGLELRYHPAETAGCETGHGSISGNEPRPKNTCQANEFNRGRRIRAHPISSNAGDCV